MSTQPAATLALPPGLGPPGPKGLQDARAGRGGQGGGAPRCWALAYVQRAKGRIRGWPVPAAPVPSAMRCTDASCAPKGCSARLIQASELVTWVRKREGQGEGPPQPHTRSSGSFHSQPPSAGWPLAGGCLPPVVPPTVLHAHAALGLACTSYPPQPGPALGHCSPTDGPVAMCSPARCPHVP